MSNYVTPPERDKADKEFLEKYRASVVEKLEQLQEARIQFEGFASAYKKRLRQFMESRFMDKFGHSGWLKIESSTNPDLNGYYKFDLNENLIRGEYFYGQENESLRAINLWVELRKLRTTASGYLCAHLPSELISADFLDSSHASRCAKPEFKERKQKQGNK